MRLSRHEARKVAHYYCLGATCGWGNLTENPIDVYVAKLKVRNHVKQNPSHIGRVRITQVISYTAPESAIYAARDNEKRG